MSETNPDSSQNLEFLPFNQESSPKDSKHRRAYLSCERCRKRKSRCEPVPGQSHSCRRCVTENQICEFRSSRSIKRKASGKIDIELPETRHQRNRNWNHGILHVNESQQHQQLRSSPHLAEQNPALVPATAPLPTRPSTERVEADTSECPEESPVLDARSRLVSTHIHNTSDALDLLTFAATGNQVHNRPSLTPAYESQASPTVYSSVYDQSTGSRPASAIWNSFVLIRKGVVSQHEVVEYLDFFFNTLWPLKPVVPSYYRQRSSYALLAMEEPVLLTCLVTISSRYHPLSGSHGEIRSERIHWQTWKFLQRFMQSVTWGSTTTRSLGAIAAMLLLIDWHVKAINNTMDFTEGDGEAISLVDSPTAAFSKTSRDTDTLTGQRRYGMTSLMEKLNIVSPAYRSNKMSWILLSNAIALAHEGCCFENEDQTPAALLSEAENIKQEWSRLVCVFIYLADEGLATRLGLEPLLPEKSRQVVRDRFSTTFANSLPDSMLWEGYFELFGEARKGREVLHSLKKTGASLSNLNLIPNLEHLGRALSRWKRQYHDRNNTNIFVGACLDMEFHYYTMYCFAPAAQALQSHMESNEMFDTESLSKFAEQAAQASHALLSIVVDILKPSRLIQYLPVRLWLMIVAASLNLLKATLAKNPNVTESDHNIVLLRSAINAIHEGSPDDAHMAIRFSKFLGIVTQASLPGSTSTAPAEGRPETYSQSRETFQAGDSGSPAFASVLEGVGISEVPLDLDAFSDPLAWWDTFYSRNGFARFP